jgi:hypothetical protein
MNLKEIMPALAEPFAPADVDFLPKQSFERDGKTVCLALPYADKRVYEDRLNAVCPGEWSTQASVTVVADRIISVVTVVVCNVAHTDLGEAFLLTASGKREENAACESLAQGFKRACAQMGLGRFLYDLEKSYLPFDAKQKRIDMAPAALQAVVLKLYRKAGLLPSAPAPAAPARQSPAPAADAAPVTTAQMTAILKLAKQYNVRDLARPTTFAEAARLLADLESREPVAS